MTLRNPQVTIEAVDQNLERVLQRLKVMLLLRIFRRSHLCFGFEPERAQVGEQMAEDLQLVGGREAIELEHDRRIKGGDVAMPYVARHGGEEDIGVTAFERACHWHLGNGIALPEIFAEK